MRTLPLLLSLAILPGMASAEQNPSADQDKRSEAVVKRGEHVMGFSHESTTHHFRLFKDGGEIDVRANDPKDKASIDQIRSHLGHIAKMFASGNFNAPMLIHDTNLPGTATMTRLKEQIRYEFSERIAARGFGLSRPARRQRMPCTPSCSFKSSIIRPGMPQQSSNA